VQAKVDEFRIFAHSPTVFCARASRKHQVQIIHRKKLAIQLSILTRDGEIHYLAI
jgi:hypothetical protein